MDDLRLRIECVMQMIEQKPDQSYADYIVCDLLRDIDDYLKEKDDEQRDCGEPH